MNFSVASQRGVVLLLLLAAISIQASTLHIESDASFEHRRPVAPPAGKALMRRDFAKSSPKSSPMSSPGSSLGAFLESTPKKVARAPSSGGKGGKDQPAKSAPTPAPAPAASADSVSSAPINIEFGGDKHGVNSKEGYLMRPEAIKSKACNANSCEDCTDPAKCFHGVTEGGWGYIVLDVQAGSTFTNYVAEVWARCPSTSTDAQWWLEILTITNGHLELYAGATKATIDGNWAQFPITGEDKARVRAFFYPSDPAKTSTAKIWMEAYKVDANVDACMAVKDCLDVLGDGSDAAYELRNGNGAQLKCLSGDQSGMSSAAQAKCNVWDSCVTTSGKKPHLLALLKAAIQPNMGLLEGVSVANETRLVADASTCVEPSIDDPESWDCECAENMIATCSGDAHAGQELEECIQTLMCANSNVCCSWKQNHCASPTCAGALMEERSQVSTKVATSGKLHNDLDGAAQGKCAE